MKLKKVMKILPAWERIRVWGNDEEIPLYDGCVANLPKSLSDLKMTKGEDCESYLEFRYERADIGDHVAVFVKE